MSEIVVTYRKLSWHRFSRSHSRRSLLTFASSSEWIFALWFHGICVVKVLERTWRALAKSPHDWQSLVDDPPSNEDNATKQVGNKKGLWKESRKMPICSVRPRPFFSGAHRGFKCWGSRGFSKKAQTHRSWPDLTYYSFKSNKNERIMLLNQQRLPWNASLVWRDQSSQAKQNKLCGPRRAGWSLRC